MELAVWRVGKPAPSKFDEGYDNTQIQFKSLDKADRKTYRLNLSTRHKDKIAMWMPYMREGVVLKVSMQPNGSNVNPFQNFTVTRDVKKEQA